MIEHNCGNCAHYRPNPTDLRQGKCHRFPPQVGFVLAQTTQGTQPVPLAEFPFVAKVDYCGEFRKEIIIAAEGSA